MKRLLLLLAIAALTLFVGAPLAASPPNTDFQAQIFAEQLVSIDLAAADKSRLALEVGESIGTSVPGARRGGLLAVVLFDRANTANRARHHSPPARAVPLERSPGHEAC